MTKKMRYYLAVGLLTAGSLLFSATPPASAGPFPPSDRPGMHDGRNHEIRPGEMKGPSKEDHEQLLNLLGIDEKTFREYVCQRYSLAEIADKQKVAVKKVVELIEAQLKEHARQQAEAIVRQKPMAPSHPRPKF